MEPVPSEVSPAIGARSAPSARNAWVVPAALVALCALGFVYARWVYAPCDDAYIYLVYVQSLFGGDGFTYNGMRVQGFTSVLWAALLAVTGGIAPNLPLAAETLSVLSGFFVVGVTYAVGRKLGLGAARALIAPFLVVTSWDFAFYMGNGLETVLYAGLVLASLGFTLEKDPEAALHSHRLPIVLILTVLTRPEGVLVAAIVLAYLVWHSRAFAAGIACVGRIAVVILPVFVLIRFYYGHWVPNTWYVKSNAGFANASQGFAYLANFAGAYVFALLAFFFAIASEARSMGRAVLPFLATIAVVLLDGTLRGGDNMVGFRAFVPALPILFLVLVWALERVDVRLVAVGATVLAAIGVATFASGRVMGSSWNVPVLAHAQSWRRDFEPRRDIGRTLDRELPPGAVVATNVGGIIPFYAKRPTIDMLGLNNEYIAHHGNRDHRLAYGHQVGDGEFVLSQRPAVVVFGGSGAPEPTHLVSDREIGNDPDFHRLYRAVRLESGATIFVRRKASPPPQPAPIDSRP